MKRFALAFLALIAIALIVVAIGFQRWRESGKPEREGEFHVIGLGHPTIVRFDSWAVPHVNASDLHDLASAVGWLHANDRMVQLELGRRHASGRLAELIGPDALEEDKRMRTLRLRHTAERYLEKLSPQSRDLLDAYASGVNSWLARHRGDLPPDLRLLHVEPEPWTPVDSLCFTLSMARDLCYPTYYEEERFRWLGVFGAEKTLDLIGKKGVVVADEVVAAAKRLADAAQVAAPPSDDHRGGSNNWAIGVGRTANSAPIVANDPHLALALPAVWYEVKLTAPDYEAYGMTLPGSPLVVIGQSEHLAWGFTNTELDTNDEFIEELSPDGNSVRRAFASAPVIHEHEAIQVKGARDVDLDLASTDVGPLLPADPTRGLPTRSLAWTAYTAFDPYETFIALARAKSVDDVPAAIANFVAPVQNLVCADKSGGLLFTLLGRVPDRPKGDGSMIAPGWDPSWSWRGLRPLETNPTIKQPADGVLASANDDVRPAGYALDLPADFAGPWRVSRIRDRLLHQDGWWPQQAAELQNDKLSLYALEIVKAIPASLSGDAKFAADELRAWNGEMQKRGASALFMLFERELTEAVFDDEFDAHRLPHLGVLRRADCLARLLRGEMSEAWFDDVRTSEVETRDAQIGRALERAWRKGKERFGMDVSQWNWGAMNLWTPRHPLADAPVVGRWFRRGPFEMAGSAHCIEVFTGSWVGDHVEVGHGASMRFVADTGDPDRSLAVLPGGQSAHPFDAHFDDQLPIYLAGKARTIEWSETAITEHTLSTLRFQP